MTDKRRNHAGAGPSPDEPGMELTPEVQAAMKSLGWLVPETAEEVLAAEREQAGAPDLLPRELFAPSDAWNRCQAEASPVTLAFPAEQDAAENLARAAREGGQIPPQIEQQMHRDRQAAERELDDGKSRPGK